MEFNRTAAILTALILTTGAMSVAWAQARDPAVKTSDSAKNSAAPADISCPKDLTGYPYQSMDIYEGPVSQNATLRPIDDFGVSPRTSGWQLNAEGGGKFGYSLVCRYGNTVKELTFNLPKDFRSCLSTQGADGKMGSTVCNKREITLVERPSPAGVAPESPHP